jgi:hypothetical protein
METILEIKDNKKFYAEITEIFENGNEYLEYSRNLQFNKLIYYKYLNFANLLDKRLTNDDKFGLKFHLEKIKKR